MTIEDGKVQIQPLEQVISLPLLWLMDFNLQTNANGSAVTSNVDFLQAYSARLS